MLGNDFSASGRRRKPGASLTAAGTRPVPPTNDRIQGGARERNDKHKK